MVKSSDSHSFGSPELTGHDGNPVVVADDLAKRLRRHAMDDAPSIGSLLRQLHPQLREALASWSVKLAAEPVEKAIVLSADGQEIGMRKGNRSRVGVEADLLEDAHLIHNHPQGTPLSDSDLQALFDTELSSVWAVGGTWLYGASIGRKGKDRSVGASFKVAWSHLSEATFAVLSDLSRHDPGIEPGSLETRHLHAVLSELAGAGFIQYCRVGCGTRPENRHLRF